MEKKKRRPALLCSSCGRPALLEGDAKGKECKLLGCEGVLVHPKLYWKYDAQDLTENHIRARYGLSFSARSAAEDLEREQWHAELKIKMAEWRKAHPEPTPFLLAYRETVGI